MKLPSPNAGAMMARWVLIIAGMAQFVAAVLWSAWMVRAYRREKRRSKEGLCLKCGFDLRHSLERCPECGQKVLKLK